MEHSVLHRAHILDPLLKAPLTPGWLVPTRLGSIAFSRKTREDLSSLPDLFLANGNRVHHLQSFIPSKRIRKLAEPEDSEKERTAGKSKNLVPSSLMSTTSEVVPSHPQHRWEIQSLAIDETRLATIDSHGSAVISMFDIESDNLQTNSEKGSLEVKPGWFLTPSDAPYNDQGWAGISLHPHSCKTSATCRYFSKTISVYDLDIPIQNIYTMASPSCINFINMPGAGRNDESCNGPTILSVAEKNQLVLYDLRISTSECPYVCRKVPGSGALYSISQSRKSANLICVAGMDRIVHVYDIRTGTVMGRWTNCVKSEIVSAWFSEDDENYCYVVGGDNEVAYGMWSQGGKRRPEGLDTMVSGAVLSSSYRTLGFRADSRWLGVTPCPGFHKTSFTGVSDTGHLYIVRSMDL